MLLTVVTFKTILTAVPSDTAALDTLPGQSALRTQGDQGGAFHSGGRTPHFRPCATRPRPKPGPVVQMALVRGRRLRWSPAPTVAVPKSAHSKRAMRPASTR